MINSILSVLVGSLGFIAGIGMLHWLLMFVLLISAGVLYLALSEQYESGKAMQLSYTSSWSVGPSSFCNQATIKPREFSHPK